MSSDTSSQKNGASPRTSTRISDRQQLAAATSSVPLFPISSSSLAPVDVPVPSSGSGANSRLIAYTSSPFVSPVSSSSRLSQRLPDVNGSCPQLHVEGHGDNNDEDAIEDVNELDEPQVQQRLLDAHTLPERNPILGPLRYRRKSLWLVVIYVPLLVIPWVLNCVLMYRPFSSPSYTEQRSGLLLTDALNAAGWLSAADVFNKIQAVLAIPVVSALLAQAAVVYSQRRSTKQKLSVRQLFALADRSWADVPGYWNARHSDIGSRLVWLGGLLILVVSIQPPLQSLFAGTEPIQVVTCLDTPVFGCSEFGPDIVGLDPEPSALQYLPQIVAVQRVSSRIMSVNEWDIQPYLWPEMWSNLNDKNHPARGTLGWYYDAKPDDSSYFVSSLLNGTTTGVLREHAIRLNSSSQCINVLRSEFPTTCLGKRPFMINFQHPGLEINICAPGAYDENAWTISRDRQDISEDLWIDTFVPYNQLLSGSFLLTVLGNFTLRCTTNTTRGYFELGNYQNGYNHGPLLDKWPTQEELNSNYNDVLNVDGGNLIPSVMDNFTIPDQLNWPQPVDAFGTYGQLAPGPLMISALAMFGNNSFWYTARNATNVTTSSAFSSICQSSAIPFTCLSEPSFDSAGEFCLQLVSGPLSQDDDELYFISMLYTWIQNFNTTEIACEALGAATYFANEAVLTSTADPNFAFNSRQIFTSEGLLTFKPTRSLQGLIIITILIALQLAGIIYLSVYIHSTPTWTDKFDSFALARIGAEMERTKHIDLPTIRHTEEKDLERLKNIDGLIGVVQDRHKEVEEGTSTLGAPATEPHTYETSPQVESPGISVSMTTDDVNEPPFQLAVGAQGLITKDLLKKTKRQEQKD